MKFYVSIIFLLITLSASAQVRTIYGFKVGINKPPIKGGFVWDFEDDAIDSDIGFLAGIDILIPLNESYNINTGIYITQETYHIHFYAPESLTYHFYYTYITLPFALQYKFINQRRYNMFVSAGTFLNYGNLTNKKIDKLDNEIEVTNILDQNWAIEPQFFGGIGLSGISKSFGTIQLQLTYNTSFFRHLNYKGILRTGANLLIEERSSRHVVPLLTMTYFPKVKARKPNVKWSRCK